MRVSSVLMILLPVVLLAACSGSGNDARRSGRTAAMLERIPTIDVSSRQFSRAIDLKAAGRCDEAIPLFYRMALRGEGFELAQYHLSDCQFRKATPSATDSDWLEALLWMRRAAEAGAPEAQGRLARVYAEAPDGLRDPVEAAMWWTLYEDNPARKRPGFIPPAEADAAYILPLIAGSLPEGKARAAAFVKKIWNAPNGANPSADRPREEGGIEMLRPDGGPQGDRQRPPGGR